MPQEAEDEMNIQFQAIFQYRTLAMPPQNCYTHPTSHMSERLKCTALWKVSKEAQDEVHVQVELVTCLLGSFQDAGEEGGDGDVARQVCLLF